MKKFSLACALILLALIYPSCNSTTDDPKYSDSLLTIVGIDPVPFCSVPLADQNLVFSDDNGQFTIANDLKNIDAKGTFYNDVILNGYTVSYEFPSGQGSAPPFSQMLNVRIVSGGETTVSVVVVRAVDKEAGYFTPGIDVNAIITFYGKDISGEDVRTTVSLTINFRDVCGGSPPSINCDQIDNDSDGSIDEETLCGGEDDDGDGSIDEDTCCVT